MQQIFLTNAVATRRRLTILSSCVIALLMLSRNPTTTVSRSCKRLQRNHGWWETVWSTYSNKMFKQTFRLSKATFQFILNKISHDLQRQVVTEDPISPECRLGICLYKLGRGDYYYTISQMSGFGVSTVSTIVQEVCQAIINNMWAECMHDVDGERVSPFIVGDSAFPLSTWLLKPYTNAILCPEQRYFNYRLSRTRMVTEGAYGQLKGRWRVLF